MAFGNSTFSDIGGAVSDLLSSQATASGLRLKGQGSFVEAQNYELASTLATKNEEFTRQSTAVKKAMADRQIYMGIGAERADIAGAGFAEGGSGVDLLRSSAAQGALQKALVGQQGLITEEGYHEQADSFFRLAQYAGMAASTQNDAASDAVRNGQISAGVKFASAFASLFTGGAPTDLTKVLPGGAPLGQGGIGSA